VAKTRMRDLLVFLPGIMGSVLRKDGKDLWAFTGQSAWQTLKTMGGWLQELRLEDDEADDGIVATRVLPDIHLIPGLKKVDGYSRIADFLLANFELIDGTLDGDDPANFLRFPYDWRRDNRINAHRLAGVIERKLTLWRDFTNDPDARVILVGHSMGGLVSRYYLEVLGGWEHTRALITLATPHRGSVAAANYLANGFKQLFIDLTEVVRSFTSIYQLLPIYRMVKQGDDWVRIVEAEEISGIDRARAGDALAFHREIEAAVESRSGDGEPPVILPFVGTQQPTLQSAVHTDGRLTVSNELPDWIDDILGEGDSTVPRVSALPIELSEAQSGTFVAERHSSVQNHASVLDDLKGRLEQLQAADLGSVRGAPPTARTPSAISVDLEDMYLPDEPVVVTARLVDAEKEMEVRARVTAAGGGPSRQFSLDAEGDVYRGDLAGLDAGLYRIEVATAAGGPGAPSAVHDVFEVLG
jgi:pimeloyl-ACP methyl ester carboxylesterase